LSIIYLSKSSISRLVQLNFTSLSIPTNPLWYRVSLEVFYEDLARQSTVAYLFQLLWASPLSRMHFSHRRRVLRSLFRTPHGLLDAPALIGLFRPVCLSVTCLSITFLSISSTNRSFARYKDALVFCRFSNNSLPHFRSLPSLTFLQPPSRASGRAELHLLPCQAS